MGNAEQQQVTGASALETLKQQERLLSAVFSGATQTAGRMGFRGELALKFAVSTAGEKRPPEIKAEQVLLTAEGADIGFLACFVDSLAYLQALVEVMGAFLVPEGKYFLFAGNIDISKRYTIDMGKLRFYVLPLDEATVYNELLELLYLERGDLKRLGNGEKLDVIATAAAGFTGEFEPIPFAQGLQVMGEVKQPENRPV